MSIWLSIIIYYVYIPSTILYPRMLMYVIVCSCCPQGLHCGLADLRSVGWQRSPRPKEGHRETGTDRGTDGTQMGKRWGVQSMLFAESLRRYTPAGSQDPKASVTRTLGKEWKRCRSRSGLKVLPLSVKNEITGEYPRYVLTVPKSTHPIRYFKCNAALLLAYTATTYRHNWVPYKDSNGSIFDTNRHMLTYHVKLLKYWKDSHWPEPQFCPVPSENFPILIYFVSLESNRCTQSYRMSNRGIWCWMYWFALIRKIYSDRVFIRDDQALFMGHSD